MRVPPLAPLAAVGVLMVLAASVPSTLGQAHQHDVSTGVVIAHDLPPSGRTYVGNLNHFVVLYLGDDAEPDFHQQNQVRVLLNDVVVFETTDDSGHDYDGVYGFDVTFLAPGAYRVEALQEGSVKAAFAGPVEWPNSEAVGTPVPEVVVPGGAGPGRPVAHSATFAALHDGAVIPHSDAVYEVFTTGSNIVTTTGQLVAAAAPATVLRIKTHTHEDMQKVDAVLPAGTGYLARVQTYRSYPSSGIDFQPGVAETRLGGGLVKAPNAPAAPPAGLPDNVVVSAPLGDLLLVGTFDPYNVVGPDTLMHLAVAVLDASRMPVQHVDFTAQLTGPDGTVLLSSKTLHEYDGVLEIDTVQSAPGPYVLRVTADRGATATIDLPFAVSPAAPALGQGPQVVTISGHEDLQVGRTADLNLHIADLAGNAYAHNEVDLVLERGSADSDARVPVLRAKLHTHDSGDFPFRLAFQEPGWYHLRVSPYPLGAQAGAQFWRDEAGAPLSIDLAVKEGDFPQPAAQDAPPATAAQESPLPIAATLAALALAALRRR